MAYGFVPVRHATGGVIRTNNYKSYTIASAYATALYQGDPVLMTTDGSLIVGTSGSAAYVGIFKGVSYRNSVTGDVVYDNYWPASQTATDIVAYVWDDPNLIFKVEADQVGTALASTDIGSNADHNAGTGSNVTKRSGAVLDSSDISANAFQFRVLGTAQDENETQWTAAGTAMDVYVVAVEHFYTTAAGI